MDEFRLSDALDNATDAEIRESFAIIGKRYDDNGGIEYPPLEVRRSVLERYVFPMLLGLEDGGAIDDAEDIIREIIKGS